MGNVKNYNAIDLARLICAILIVMLHVEPFGTAGAGSFYAHLNFVIQNYLARIAVPFFFIVSGYFHYVLQNPESVSWGRTKQYIIRMLRIYLIWTLIFLPIVIRSNLSDPEWGGGTLPAILKYFRDLIFTGSYVHLWYLPALIFAVFLTSFLLRKGVRPESILIAAFVFYLIGLLEQSWYGLIVLLEEIIPVLKDGEELLLSVIVTTRNGLFMGFFFVALGMFLAFRKPQITARRAFILFVISMAAMGIDLYVLTEAGWIKAYDMSLFLIPVSLFFFSFLLKTELPDSRIFTYLRQISALLFFSHFFFYWAISRILSKVCNHLVNSPWNFILTLSSSLLFSVIVVKLSRFRSFRWLKYLYS